jgi:hypothetical protein
MTGMEGYQRACRLAVSLDMTPRWRPRKRRRLAFELAQAAHIADADYGVPPGTLAAILASQKRTESKP